MDGYAIARTIRQDAELKNVYLIAISGYAEDEDQQLARQAGFDEYYVKPIDLKFLDQSSVCLAAPACRAVHRSVECRLSSDSGFQLWGELAELLRLLVFFAASS